MPARVGKGMCGARTEAENPPNGLAKQLPPDCSYRALGAALIDGCMCRNGTDRLGEGTRYRISTLPSNAHALDLWDQAECVEVIRLGTLQPAGLERSLSSRTIGLGRITR